MWTINYTGTTGNDTIRLAAYGQPGSANTYTLNGLTGTDIFDLVTGNSYASRFVSTNFTIGTADANGLIVISGASAGGDKFTFNLTSVETIIFKDKTVSLSYQTPVTPTPTILTGTSGNDIFNGTGVETVLFTGNEANYTITKSGSGFSVKDNVGSDGTDTVVNIEKLQFADHTLIIDSHPGFNLLESYRIYKAAFDRTPDYGGLGFWYNSINHGSLLTDVAAGFINSSEFRAMYGNNPTDTTFVTLLYQHVLGRTPDQGGYDFWLNDLQVETRAQVLAHFSESAENIANVAGVISNGIIYQPYTG